MSRLRAVRYARFARISPVSFLRASPEDERRGGAEGEGFEPSEACTSTVFKTVPFGRSGTPPPTLLVGGASITSYFGSTRSKPQIGRSTSGTTNAPSGSW